MKIKITDDAKFHIENAIKFYESQNSGLGRYFLDSISSDIESLQIYFGIHIKIKNYYRFLSKRFPYAVYYKYDEKNIYIYAVLDCRKNPTFINNVLK